MKKLSPEQRSALVERASAGEAFKNLAREFGVSRTHVRRLARGAGVERASTHATDKDVPQPFGEFGAGYLRRHGGTIGEDYDRHWASLQDSNALIAEMSNDPVVAAMLFAIENSVRGTPYTVVPASDAPADKAVADFVRDCLDDMSHTFEDHISQAVSFIRYGFSLFEVVYKLRPDGHIGWSKFAVRPQDSLAPGDEWVFDDHGGVRGFNQTLWATGQKVFIPIEKAILYRTTAMKNNPQGQSILRACYIPWYAAKNLREIEAITAERTALGVPAVFLGKDTRKGGSDSDFDRAKKVVRDLRADEQAGVVFPYPSQKFTNDGTGVHFEIVNPPTQGPVDLDKAIRRYEVSIARTLLAQWLYLGSESVGSFALGEGQAQFFSSALDGWLRNFASTLNRFVLPRLIKLNAFTGVTGFPRIEFQPIGKGDTTKKIAAIGIALENAAISNDPTLEAEVRKMLGLPQLEAPDDPAPDDKVPDGPAPDREEGQRAEAFEESVRPRSGLVTLLDRAVKMLRGSRDRQDAPELTTLLVELKGLAGRLWTEEQREAGEATRERGEGIEWVLDPLSTKHCDDCLRFAGTYESFDQMLAETGGGMPGTVQCSSNCRCTLQPTERGGA